MTRQLLEESGALHFSIPEGKRVLDFSTVVAAPYAACMLGDAGADIIKIENPKVPDALRGWSTLKELGIEPYHSVVGRNKFPVTINMKADEGKEIFTELIKQSDVLIENMRVGAMDRLGFSTERILEINPGIIIGKVSGYGMTGPKNQQPGFGTLAEAYSGSSSLIRWRTRLRSSALRKSQDSPSLPPRRSKHVPGDRPR